MLVYSITATDLIPRIFCTLLLLAASLNAQNNRWDNLKCTEPKMSVPRGNRVLMTCNISNNITDVTIEWTDCGKNRTIFCKMSPGNYYRDALRLQIQGGQAQLVITDVQDIHAGQYFFRVHGLQRTITKFILNVAELQDQEEADCQGRLTFSDCQGRLTFSDCQDLTTNNQKPETARTSVEPPPASRMQVTIVVLFIIFLITGIGVFAWYKHRCSLRCHRVPEPVLSQGSPCRPYLPLP